jgi:hypothetical protein
MGWTLGANRESGAIRFSPSLLFPVPALGDLGLLGSKTVKLNFFDGLCGYTHLPSWPCRGTGAPLSYRWSTVSAGFQSPLLSIQD